MLSASPSIEPTKGELHLMQRKRLTDRHEKLMNKIMSQNEDKSKYWILGMAKSKRKNGRTTITPFMEARYVQPDLVKEAYLYEIDNVAGTTTLLWVMHPNNKLSVPTIGKFISVASTSGVLGTEVMVQPTGVNNE